MRTIRTRDGIIYLSESKAICQFCNRKIPFDEIENKFIKQNKYYIRMKCICKKYIGITQNIKGDFVAYELNYKKSIYFI